MSQSTAKQQSRTRGLDCSADIAQAGAVAGGRGGVQGAASKDVKKGEHRVCERSTKGEGLVRPEARRVVAIGTGKHQRSAPQSIDSDGRRCCDRDIQVRSRVGENTGGCLRARLGEVEKWPK